MQVDGQFDLASFKASGEFDEAWYVSQYPDVRDVGIDPALHYLWLGKKLGRQPRADTASDPRALAQSHILKSSQGHIGINDSLCLFSHYDKHDQIDRYVVEYLKSIRECGFSTIFISTCGSLAEVELRKVRPFVSEIVVRENIGRDFGSWFWGITAFYKPGRFKRLLLANDSVYGPLFPLLDVFEDMGSRSLDFWGITDSIECEYHVQSYFVVFEEGFLNNPAFSQFWDQYEFEQDKRKVIDNFEIGLTATAIKLGFRVGALCSYFDVRRQALALMDRPQGTGRTTAQCKLTPVNSSHFFWRALVQYHRCPLLKIELLRDNPSRIDDVHLWEEVIRDNSNFNPSLISSHLSRINEIQTNELERAR